MSGNGRLYVSNLKWEVTDEELSKIFSAHGEVAEARIVRDNRNDWSRGFAFVAFKNGADAQAAAAALNGFELQGRNIRVEEAKSDGPRPPREKSTEASSSNGDAAASSDAAAKPSARRSNRRGGRGRGRGRGRGAAVAAAAAASGAAAAPAPAASS